MLNERLSQMRKPFVVFIGLQDVIDGLVDEGLLVRSRPAS